MSSAEEHPSYGISLINLAGLYCSMGRYDQAEPLYLEAKAVQEKALGKEHPIYATSLSNLGLLYESMGDFEVAEKLLQEGLYAWSSTITKGLWDHLSVRRAHGSAIVKNPLLDRHLLCDGRQIPVVAVSVETLVTRGPSICQGVRRIGIGLLLSSFHFLFRLLFLSVTHHEQNEDKRHDKG